MSDAIIFGAIGGASVLLGFHLVRCAFLAIRFSLRSIEHMVMAPSVNKLLEVMREMNASMLDRAGQQTQENQVSASGSNSSGCRSQ